MAFANKAYFHDLTSTLAGNLLVAGGVTLMVVGGFWLRRIVRVQY